MTEFEKNGLLEALATIQKVCILHPNCKTCPLSDKDGDCLFTAAVIAPKDWHIKEPESETWKVFK